MTLVATLLRNRRRSLLVLLLAVAVLGALQSTAYSDVAGTTAASREAFARQSEPLARQVVFLAPAPTDLSTLGGYLTWRVFNFVALALGIWAMWFAAATSRGDEEDGITEQVLATGTTRATAVLAATAAFAIAAAVVVTALVAAVWVGGDGSLGGADLAGQGLALFALVSVMFGLGLVFAQLMRTVRAAAGVGVAAAFLLNFVNSMSSAVDALVPVRPVSPYSWYTRSEPLVMGGSLSVGPTIGLLLAAVVLVAFAAALFERRDLGQAVIARRDTSARVTTPRATGWFRRPVLGAVYERRRGLLGWMLGAMWLVAFFTSIAPDLIDALQQIDALRAYLAAIAEGNVQQGVIGLFLIGTLQFVLALFAITWVAQWAEDDRSGRLEMELSADVSRTAVVVRRAASLAAASAFILAAAMAVLVLMAAQQGSPIAVSAAVRTGLVLLPFTLAFAAAGAVLTATIPRGAVTALTLFAVVSYFVKEIGPIYGWPDWVLDLSVFQLVGNPLVASPEAAPLVGLCVVTVAGFVVAAMLMRTRDVGS